MFLNRREAGRDLALQLSAYSALPDVVVLGLPRGGVPVAYAIALALDAPLDPFLARAEAPQRGIARLGRPVSCEEAELARRQRVYLAHARPMPVAGRTAILVDDGMTTGGSMRSAIRSLREKGPAEIVVAVPVAPPRVFDEARAEADAGICLLTPEPFESVERWYRYYAPTSDGEVRELIALAREKGLGTHGLGWAPELPDPRAA